MNTPQHDGRGYSQTKRPIPAIGRTLRGLRERIQDLRSQLLDANEGLLKMREVNQEQAEQIAQLRVKKISR